MFDNDEYFDLKVPLVIVTCLVVLGGGIYFGISSSNKVKEAVNIKEEQINEIEKLTENKETSREIFALSETCEIWLKKGTDNNSMIGMIPTELLNKSEEEIRSYLEEKYPDNNIESITYGQIVLSENEPVKNENIKNKYSLEVQNGFITVYKYDMNGNRHVERETSIKVDLLPQTVQEQIQQGILIDTIDEAYVLLENLSS